MVVFVIREFYFFHLCSSFSLRYLSLAYGAAFVRLIK